jgi:hypothetical protein
MRATSIASLVVTALLAVTPRAQAQPAAPAEAAPEPASDEPVPGSRLRLEWIGVEISPVARSEGPSSLGPAPSRWQIGLGGIVRTMRLRWSHAYWTPVQAGLFVEQIRNDQTIYLHIETEGGVRLPLAGGSQAVELGLAAGVGILAIPYRAGCDGSCIVGGAGAILSPVARYLVKEGPGLTVGFTLRAVLPLQVPEGDHLGDLTDRGFLFLGGVDVAFGR